MPSRDEILAAARRYIGTPYHHQGALAGAGCDCLGLVRGVWRDLYGSEPEMPPPYTPDWGEIGKVEHLLEAARRHMVPVTLGEAQAGDVLIFRMRPGSIAKHAAILTGPDRMIHAQSRDKVREVSFGGFWRARAVAAFGWPLEWAAAHPLSGVQGDREPSARSVTFGPLYKQGDLAELILLKIERVP